MNLYDLVYIDETGYHYADYPTFLAWRQEQYRAIYGADIYIEPDSQDGQLIAIQAQSDFDTAALGAAIYNSFSPVTAQGVGLARVVKINGLNKKSASRSTVDVEIVGQSGTYIENGIVEDTLSQKWDVPTTVIPGTGSIIVTAVSQIDGAVVAAPNTVNKIFTPTLGWQTVDNANAATPGAPVESDAELRIRQAQSTANPSLTVIEGSNGAVANLEGVTKVRTYENDTNITDGNGIPGHSVCTVVAGGDSTEIAETIMLHKTPGAGTYGDTPVDVIDPAGMPITIRFERAKDAVIGVQVTLAAGVGWSPDYVLLIQNSVAAVIKALQIGGNVLITKLYAPAYLAGTAAGSTYDIASILIKKGGDPFDDNNIPLDFNEQAICDGPTDVTVIVT